MRPFPFKNRRRNITYIFVPVPCENIPSLELKLYRVPKPPLRSIEITRLQFCEILSRRTSSAFVARTREREREREREKRKWRGVNFPRSIVRGCGITLEHASRVEKGRGGTRRNGTRHRVFIFYPRISDRDTIGSYFMYRPV